MAKRSRVRVTDRDRGARDLVKRVFDLATNSVPVTVGIHAQAGSEAHGDGGVTLLQVAEWMEFGTSKVPERSYIRAYFDENGERIQKMLEVMAVSVAAGKRTRQQAIELVGQKIVGEIQARISRGIPPPNAESTIRQKGSSTPLVNTGQLRAGISYEVKE